MEDFEDIVLDPLPPQSRATPHGRAMLGMAHFAGRALSATGFLLLVLAGATNLGATLLALLLNRASPGKGTFFLILVGVAWLFWIGLAFLRWRLNTAGPGPARGTTWGIVVEEEEEADPAPQAPFHQRATPSQPAGQSSARDGDRGDTADSKAQPGADETGSGSHLSPGARADGTMSVDVSERAFRAAQEYSVRRSTPFPRVEAVQRSIRVLVGGPQQPAWVRFDLRPLVFSFVAVAVSIPVVMVSAVLSMIALLASASPF